MKFKLLLSCFILLSVIVSAQPESSPGYIIKQQGDTLYGNIEMINDKGMGMNCRFRLNEKDSLIEYSPNDINAYGFTDGDYYVSKQPDSVLVFMKRIGKPKNSIWYLQDKVGMHYYIEKTNGKLLKIPYYVKKVNRYGQLCLIHSNSNYNLKDTIETDEPGTTSRNKVREALNIEMNIGKVFNKDISWGSNIYQGGIILSVCDPTVDGNFYFRTGVQKLNFFDGYNNSALRIPLQIEYHFSKGIIVPRIACGIHFYSPYLLTNSYMVGLNLRFSKSVSWTATFDTDYMFDNIFFIFGTPVFKSLSTGLIISL